MLRSIRVFLVVFLCFFGRRLHAPTRAVEETFEEQKKFAFMLLKDKPEALASDPDLALLKKISDAGMLEPYVLGSAPDRRIVIDYLAYREEHRQQREDYLSQFVVPALALPAKP
jgi:hypothetical protein